jgi:hypothetical protein
LTVRTIVGSGPRRRPLPLEREAVERALRVCAFWRCDPLSAACEAIAAREDAGIFADSIGHPADWLPLGIVCETPDQLRERLRGYP